VRLVVEKVSLVGIRGCGEDCSQTEIIGGVGAITGYRLATNCAQMMKSLLVVAAGLALSLNAQAKEREGLSGEYVELHACEVYTGGCTASAQITQGGRSLVRVWNFSDGQTAVVLETADQNLALPDTRAKSTVMYLPEQASGAQREEMSRWLKESGVTATQTRVVPISYQREGAHIAVKAGEAVAFSTRAIDACDAGGCGEQLWYTPRGHTGAYTVLVNDQSSVEEPLLRLSWKDHAAKSIFFGKFGTAEPPEFTLASIP